MSSTLQIVPISHMKSASLTGHLSAGSRPFSGPQVAHPGQAGRGTTPQTKRETKKRKGHF